MKKKPSAETQLRQMKREYKATLEQLNEWKKISFQYRARATKAEQSAAEWEARFDALLKCGKPEIEAPNDR